MVVPLRGEDLSALSGIRDDNGLFACVEADVVFAGVNPEENPPGSPPTLRGFASPPGGGDLIKPPMLTSCLTVEFRLRSTLPFCLALFISAIHAGCCCGGGVGFGLGDSGLFKALSSQLDFVGLHLLGSIVLDGLIGTGLSGRGAAFSEVASSVALLEREVCEREAGSVGLTKLPLLSFADAVKLLLIELGVLGRWPSWVIVALL